MIHPYIDGLERFYKLDGPDIELVTYGYGNFKQLADLIDHYYSNDAQREAIRQRGFERTKQHSTWSLRIEEMFDVLRAEGAIS